MEHPGFQDRQASADDTRRQEPWSGACTLLARGGMGLPIPKFGVLHAGGWGSDSRHTLRALQAAGGTCITCWRTRAAAACSSRIVSAPVARCHNAAYT